MRLHCQLHLKVNTCSKKDDSAYRYDVYLACGWELKLQYIAAIYVNKEEHMCLGIIYRLDYKGERGSAKESQTQVRPPQKRVTETISSGPLDPFDVVVLFLSFPPSIVPRFSESLSGNRVSFDLFSGVRNFVFPISWRERKGSKRGRFLLKARWFQNWNPDFCFLLKLLIG